MKIHPSKCALFCALSFSLTTYSNAGQASPDKTTVNAVAKDDGWEFSAGLPGWLAGLKGDIGLGGLDPVHVDVPFSKILDHLDMVAALTLEAQHGRVGLYVDGMYLKISAGGSTPGPLLNSIEVTQRQVIAEAGLSYRILEGARGYVDLLAGARYIYLDGTIHFDVNEAGVQSVSNNIADTAVSAVEVKAQAAIDKARNQIASKVAAATENIDGTVLKGKIRERIVSEVKDIIRDKIEDAIDGYPRPPSRDGRVTAALQKLVDAKVAEDEATATLKAARAQPGTVLTGAEAVIRARIQAAAASARAKAQSAARKARKELASRINSAITTAIPENVSGAKGWVDPYIGLRTRYNITDRLYLSARADIGGFGISSELDWQALGALGWQLTRHTSAELGYRYLSIDYAKDGFVYDAAMGGAFVGLTYKF